ncbi:MAG TPA: signal peptidase I [Gallionella sp.]|nr:signal peptidase I [Gallionella sp.]
MKNRPNKWVAAVLCLVFPPIGLLYVAELAWAAIYFSALLIIGAFALLQWILVVAVVLSWGLSVVGAIHSYRLANAYPVNKSRPRYSRWYGLLGVCFGLFAAVFTFRAFLFEPFRFPSRSMIPTVEPGSYLIVKKWGYGHYGSYGITPFKQEITADLQRGDLIVFDHPEERSMQYMMRLIALPGDKITYRDKKLSINGSEIPRRKVDDYIDQGNGLLPLVKMSRFEETLDAGVHSTVITDERPESVIGSPSFPLKENCIFESNGVSA